MQIKIQLQTSGCVSSHIRSEYSQNIII